MNFIERGLDGRCHLHDLPFDKYERPLVKHLTGARSRFTQVVGVGGRLAGIGGAGCALANCPDHNLGSRAGTAVARARPGGYRFAGRCATGHRGTATWR